MPHIRYIKDPIYLQRQTVVTVPEHQVPGLTPHIKAMVIMCKKHRLGSMCGPEAGVNFNFFIAENPNPRDPDFDVCFSPTVTPVEEEGTTKIEEQGVDGKNYIVDRWAKVKMDWLYHNGKAFEERSGEFEGEVAYIAQRQCDRLNGIYVGNSDDDVEVESPVVQN